MKLTIGLILVTLAGISGADEALTDEQRTAVAKYAMEVGYCAGVYEGFTSIAEGSEAETEMVMGHSRGYWVASYSIFLSLGNSKDAAHKAATDRQAVGFTWASVFNKDEDITLLSNEIVRCGAYSSEVAELVKANLANIYANPG